MASNRDPAKVGSNTIAADGTSAGLVRTDRMVDHVMFACT
jgi:hypothetical protein